MIQTLSSAYFPQEHIYIKRHTYTLVLELLHNNQPEQHTSVVTGYVSMMPD